MKLIHRIAYYMGGFAIGLVLLAFFLSGKRASCDYTPDARVLKNIRIKERLYSQQALDAMRSHNIDSSDISTVLRRGDVDFQRSNTQLDSCKIYWITGRASEKDLELLFKNCDSVATLQEVKVGS